MHYDLTVCDTHHDMLFMVFISYTLTLQVATAYQGNPGTKHKLWNNMSIKENSTQRYILNMQVPLECCYT